jgi:hypothetical protein
VDEEAPDRVTWQYTFPERTADRITCGHGRVTCISHILFVRKKLTPNMYFQLIAPDEGAGGRPNSILFHIIFIVLKKCSLMRKYRLK